MENVDVIVRNVQVFNTYLKKFVKADVSVLGEKFYYIDRKQSGELNGKTVIDGTGKYMIPGLVDIHMHIESSMMTPAPFGACVAGYGVTTIVSEPHEMANVKGLKGIHEMINAAKGAPIDIYYGIPSSVPSTNALLETTGGVIDYEAMKQLMLETDVICVGEIMNYREIIRENNLEIMKFLSYLQSENPQYVMEGHCPALVDLDLAKFLYIGIDGDHTEHTLEEIKQRMENGMFIELQDKMLKPEILEYIKENRLYEHCAFVTDDTMADSLYEEGQLNKVVEKAIKAGFPLEEAIYCSTYTPARRMNLRDRGAIAPGRLADFALLSSPAVMEPCMVYKNGRCIYKQGAAVGHVEEYYRFPKDFYESIHLPEIHKEQFRVQVSTKKCEVQVRVMKVKDGSTQTKEELVTMPVKDGYIQWEDSGCLLAVVMERHGKNGNIGYGFVTGDCIKEGAVATTYFHDHHNLFVVGKSADDMLKSAKRIKELQGGIVTVKKETILAELPLPVGGILSEGSVQEIGTALKHVRESMINLGYKHYNPIMSLCTLGLPVSPALKLTDCGLIDVKEGRRVDLCCSTH